MDGILDAVRLDALNASTRPSKQTDLNVAVLRFSHSPTRLISADKVVNELDTSSKQAVELNGTVKGISYIMELNQCLNSN